MVAGEQLEAWLQKGSEAISYAGETKLAKSAYDLTDPYVHYLAKYEQVKDVGTRVAEKGKAFAEKVQEQ